MKLSNYYFAAFIIIAAFIDSMFVAPVFGIQWYSQKFMYEVSTYLIWIKLVLVSIALYMLTTSISKKSQNTVKAKLVSVLLLLMAGVQILALALTCIWYVVVGTQANNYQQQGNIVMYTSDVGALGSAYHHFSYQCVDKYGFYTLTPIATIDWLRDMSFFEKNEQLIISYNGGKTQPQQLKKIDLHGLKCDAPESCICRALSKTNDNGFTNNIHFYFLRLKS